MLEGKQKNNQRNLILILIVVVLIIIASVIGIIYANGDGKLHKQLDLAKRYMMEMNYEQAIASYEGVIAIDPKSVEAYLGLAEVYISMATEDDPNTVQKSEYYEKALKALNTGLEAINDSEDKKLIDARIEEIESLIIEMDADSNLDSEGLEQGLDASLIGTKWIEIYPWTDIKYMDTFICYSDGTCDYYFFDYDKYYEDAENGIAKLYGKVGNYISGYKPMTDYLICNKVSYDETDEEIIINCNGGLPIVMKNDFLTCDENFSGELFLKISKDENIWGSERVGLYNRYLEALEEKEIKVDKEIEFILCDCVSTHISGLNALYEITEDGMLNCYSCFIDTYDGNVGVDVFSDYEGKTMPLSIQDDGTILADIGVYNVEAIEINVISDELAIFVTKYEGGGESVSYCCSVDKLEKILNAEIF